mmetsp:Transcript_76942/g.213805  ORF Transcript_76942/g.213805 Transcript_76942/m.213805 type:complete len:230 (-) Transcript_76942:914-1603(-)
MFQCTDHGSSRAGRCRYGGANRVDQTNAFAQPQCASCGAGSANGTSRAPYWCQGGLEVEHILVLLLRLCCLLFHTSKPQLHSAFPQAGNGLGGPRAVGPAVIHIPVCIWLVQVLGRRAGRLFEPQESLLFGALGLRGAERGVRAQLHSSVVRHMVVPERLFPGPGGAAVRQDDHELVRPGRAGSLVVGLARLNQPRRLPRPLLCRRPCGVLRLAIWHVRARGAGSRDRC